MKLFDFFKKKSNTEPHHSEEPKRALFLSVSKYNEYIVHFIMLQQRGNYAPISAYEKPGGEIVGFLYMIGSDKSYSLSAQEVIARMEVRFEEKLARGEINSYVILYHSQFENDDNHRPANDENELKAITVAYHFNDGEKGKIALPYSSQKGEITYQGFNNFSREENNVIFNTRLIEKKDYFQDREDIKAPITENEAGLRISKSNSSDLSNMWCGIFGFENYRKSDGSDAQEIHFALALSKEAIFVKNNLSISQLEYKDIVLKAISVDGVPTTIIPVVKTDYVIDVVNNEINEWENIDNLEAIVTGRGRDTFGLIYFATDYAENSEIYRTQKSLKIKISGIAFVVDISTVDQKEEEPKISEDFTAYMPNNDLPNYACFDFVGQVEDFRETYLLEENSLKGYIMNVRLITNPDVENFFTIDMFVAPDNMRFNELTKGMKIAGVFQMQGQIA